MRKLLPSHPFALALALLFLLAGLASTIRWPVAYSQATLRLSIRRDTTNGLPYGDSHAAGVSSIVSGSASPGALLTFILTRSAGPPVLRTSSADQSGSFVVSMDYPIADGDSLSVSDGTTTRTIAVPALTFRSDVLHHLITGSAPANITTTSLGAPHSLSIAFGGAARQVTTEANGLFVADFTANPFQPGALGALHYVTPAGDSIYKPLLAVDPFARGQAGDGWADIILGQPNFGQTTFNETVGNALFNPGGIYVDRSAQPNRVYVYDSGNSRVLGLRYLGETDTGQPCTSDSDYSAPCRIQAGRTADLILGQPSPNSSACNADSAYQSYPDVPPASATTLCGMREEQNSLSEGGSGATMAADAQGNLYVPDVFNNRILRYSSPFTTDTIADFVWGQADFAGVTCNRGASFDHPDARSLCLGPPPGLGELRAGVAVDPAGNLWVADNQNNRVLRFPFDAGQGVPAQTADLVLGQPNFTSSASGSGLHQMNRPASVRVSAGIVYVADSLNNRVLVFTPPFANGTSAARLLGSGLANPLGLEIDPSGGIWVDDADHQRFVRFVNDVQVEAVPGDEGRAWGGIGIDRDGDLMWAGWDQQQALHFSKPAGQAAYSKDAVFLQSENGGGFNRTTARAFNGGKGLEVTADQLIYGDGSRILFWNNPQSLTNYQPADGVLGAPNFTTRERWGPWFERMRADGSGRLWALRGNFNGATLYAYQLPLTTGAAPIYTINSPLPLLGGGTVTWSPSLYLSGIEVQPSCDCVWVADEDNHRVLRIRNVTTQPVVDIVLGQLNAAGMSCNQGRGRNFPLRNSLCNPGALAFDKAGNLYLADDNTEFDGNLRLLEFDAGTLPAAPPTAAFGIPATRVFGRNGDFTAPNCLPFNQDPMCGPWEPAFDGNGLMVIGFNGYLGPRFPMIYKNPLSNPLPVAALGDFQSQPTTARFDQFGNLYMLDHNRSRILIYHGVYTQPTTSTPTPSPSHTPIATATQTPTASSTPTTPPAPTMTPDDQDHRVFLPSVKR